MVVNFEICYVSRQTFAKKLMLNIDDACARQKINS